MSEVKAPTIEEIEAEWAKDSKLEKSTIAEQSLDTDYIHAKYLKLYRLCKDQYMRLTRTLDRMEFDAREYYSGKASDAAYKKKPFDKKVMKQDLDKYVRVDPDVVKVSIATDKVKLKIELCESIIKQLSYRSFTIKNTIAYLQFLSGNV